MEMVKFKDLESNTILGGILTDEGNIICGCCGGLIEKDDIQFEIMEILPWIDISNEILGE